MSKYIEVKRETLEQVYFDVCDLSYGELPMGEESVKDALKSIKELLETMGV